MAMKHIRLRVREGRIEPIEPIELAEGTEIEALVPEAAETAEHPGMKPRPLRTRALGVVQPLTKEAIYEDVG